MVGSLTVAMVCMAVLLACAKIDPARHLTQDLRRLDADFDQAWEATIRTLTERGYDVRTMNRAAGIIETGWLTINPEYAATILVTEWEDRYCTCGKPALGQAFRAKQARLALLLHPVRHGETGLGVEAFFRTQRYSDAPFWANRSLGDVECNSRGRLEEEVRVQIQIRALSDRLERLRRGTP